MSIVFFLRSFHLTLLTSTFSLKFKVAFLSCQIPWEGRSVEDERAPTLNRSSTRKREGDESPDRMECSLSSIPVRVSFLLVDLRFPFFPTSIHFLLFITAWLGIDYRWRFVCERERGRAKRQNSIFLLPPLSNALEEFHQGINHELVPIELKGQGLWISRTMDIPKGEVLLERGEGGGKFLGHF